MKLFCCCVKVKNIIYHTVKDAIAVLDADHGPEDSHWNFLCKTYYLLKFLKQIRSWPNKRMRKDVCRWWWTISNFFTISCVNTATLLWDLSAVGTSSSAVDRQVLVAIGADPYVMDSCPNCCKMWCVLVCSETRIRSWCMGNPVLHIFCGS